MAIRDLIPWRRERLPVRREEQDPFLSLQQEWDRMLDEFFEGQEWAGFAPSVDVVETDQEVKVTAELPGMEAEDVDVTVSHGTLTLKGEKKQEHQEEGEGYYRSERSYGAFQRSIPLPSTVDTEQAEAAFEKGVLTVTFAKTVTEKTRQKIAVKSK
jgi:HSP20 family protein